MNNLIINQQCVLVAKAVSSCWFVLGGVLQKAERADPSPSLNTGETTECWVQSWNPQCRRDMDTGGASLFTGCEDD